TACTTRRRCASGDFIRRIRSAARLTATTGLSGLWMACSSAPAPGTTFTTRARYITGLITSAACGIHIASMIETGSSSAIRGSMTADSENFTAVILIVDGKAAGSGKVASSMIGAGDMSVARVVGAVADKGRLIEDG